MKERKERKEEEEEEKEEEDCGKEWCEKYSDDKEHERQDFDHEG